MRTTWVPHEEPRDLTPAGSVTCCSQKTTRGAAGCPTDGPCCFSGQEASAETTQPLPGMPLYRGHSVVLSTVSGEGQDRKDPNKFSQDHQEEDGHLVRIHKKFLKRF